MSDDKPACTVTCRECSPRHRWEQPFPTVEAADRWKVAHTRAYGHDDYETVEAGE